MVIVLLVWIFVRLCRVVIFIDLGKIWSISKKRVFIFFKYRILGVVYYKYYIDNNIKSNIN